MNRLSGSLCIYLFNIFYIKMWGLSDVKLRISIKIRDESIWHSSAPSPLSRRGQYQGWNEQSEAMFIVWTKKPVQTGRRTVSELCPHIF